MVEKSGLIINLYAVYDKVGELYDTPFFARDDVFAKRRFIMMNDDEGTMLGDFGEDFELHRVGSFETYSGKLEVPVKPIVIIEGDQIVKMKEKK